MLCSKVALSGSAPKFHQRRYLLRRDRLTIRYQESRNSVWHGFSSPYYPLPTPLHFREGDASLALVLTAAIFIRRLADFV
jgi:hypothetical protein